MRSPSPGGMYYDEVSDMLKGICQMGKIVGFDLVEVAPQPRPCGNYLPACRHDDAEPDGANYEIQKIRQQTGRFVTFFLSSRAIAILFRSG